MWRIRDRRTFVELRRHGRRARHGGVSVTYLPAAPGSAATPPRVAFAVPRKVGTAVTRNRVRRVIRAHLRARQGHPTTALPGGAYLVAVRASGTAPDTTLLAADVGRCLERLTAVPA